MWLDSRRYLICKAVHYLLLRSTHESCHTRIVWLQGCYTAHTTRKILFSYFNIMKRVFSSSPNSSQMVWAPSRTLTNGRVVGWHGPPAEHFEAYALCQLLELGLDALVVQLVQEEDSGGVATERGEVYLVRVSGTTEKRVWLLCCEYMGCIGRRWR